MSIVMKLAFFSILCANAPLGLTTIALGGLEFGGSVLEKYASKKGAEGFGELMKRWTEKEKTFRSVEDVVPIVTHYWGENFEKILRKMEADDSNAEKIFTEEREMIKKMAEKLNKIDDIEKDEKSDLDMIEEWMNLLKKFRGEIREEVKLLELKMDIDLIVEDKNFQQGGKFHKLKIFQEQAFQAVKKREEEFLDKEYEQFVNKISNVESLTFSSRILFAMRSLIAEGYFIIFQKKKIQGGIQIFQNAIADTCAFEIKTKDDFKKELQKLRNRETLQSEVLKKLVRAKPQEWKEVHEKIQKIKKYAAEIEEGFDKPEIAYADGYGVSDPTHCKVKFLYNLWLNLCVKTLEVVEKVDNP